MRLTSSIPRFDPFEFQLFEFQLFELQLFEFQPCCSLSRSHGYAHPRVNPSSYPLNPSVPRLPSDAARPHPLRPHPPVNPTSTQRLPMSTWRPPNHAQRMVSTPAAAAPLTSYNRPNFVPRFHSLASTTRASPTSAFSLHFDLTGLLTVLAPVSPLLDEQRQKLLAHPSVLEHAHKVMGNNQCRAAAGAFAGSCPG